MDKIEDITTNKRKINMFYDSVKFLNDNRVSYVKQNVTHFILNFNGLYYVDFWPTTGRFYFRDEKIKGEGLAQLLSTSKKIFNNEKIVFIKNNKMAIDTILKFLGLNKSLRINFKAKNDYLEEINILSIGLFCKRVLKNG